MSLFLKFNPVFTEKVRRIEEELHHQKIITGGGEKMLYGKFEKAYKTFYTENLREGKRVNEIDFYKNRLAELEQTEIDIINLENSTSTTKFHGVLSIIFDIKKLAQKRINEFNSPSTPIPQTEKKYKKISFEWQKEDELLDLFFIKLKSIGLISSNSYKADFIQVFLSSDLISEKKSIAWLRSNVLFAYMFEELSANNFIPPNSNFASIIGSSKCFLKKSKKAFNSRDITSAKHSAIEKKPRDHEKIDQILKELKEKP